jgi:hypothetical protein
MAPRQKPLAKMGTDKTGATRNDGTHAAILSGLRRVVSNAFRSLALFRILVITRARTLGKLGNAHFQNIPCPLCYEGILGTFCR